MYLHLRKFMIKFPSLGTSHHRGVARVNDPERVSYLTKIMYFFSILPIYLEMR